MMDIKGQFVWTLGSVIRVTQLISILKKLFVSYLSITWIMTHWIQGKNSILAITWIIWITRFLFILVSISFAYTLRNPVSMGLRKTQVTKIWNLYTQSNAQAAWVNGCSSHLLNGLISFITKVHLFVY